MKKSRDARHNKPRPSQRFIHIRQMAALNSTSRYFCSADQNVDPKFTGVIAVAFEDMFIRFDRMHERSPSDLGYEIWHQETGVTGLPDLINRVILRSLVLTHCQHCPDLEHSARQRSFGINCSVLSA